MSKYNLRCETKLLIKMLRVERDYYSSSGPGKLESELVRRDITNKINELERLFKRVSLYKNERRKIRKTSKGQNVQRTQSQI